MPRTAPSPHIEKLSVWGVTRRARQPRRFSDLKGPQPPSAHLYLTDPIEQLYEVAGPRPHVQLLYQNLIHGEGDRSRRAW